MKLSLNVGDWATIAFFALAVVLGCYSQAKPNAKAPASSSATTANQSNSGTAVAAVGLE